MTREELRIRLGLEKSLFEPKTPIAERMNDIEECAEMAYVNSELALALLDMEVE